jgi:hypothetical protein
MAVLRLVLVRLIMVTGGESHMNVAIGSAPSFGELGRLEEADAKEARCHDARIREATADSISRSSREYVAPWSVTCSMRGSPSRQAS